MAVDDTWQLQTRGSGTEGGMVGEVEGYLWTRRRSADVTREEAAAAGWGSNAKAEMVCDVLFF